MSPDYPDKKFEESKIFERLHYEPEPAGYKLNLPWIIQQQIAATNGIQYVDSIGKLKDYPHYELPVGKVSEGIMLDIGCGWGRWLIAGAEKGYIPVGIDIRLEFCEASLQTLHHQKINGYAVVADLRELPFHDNLFNLVWSFSVIQHTHRDRLTSCLKDIYRVLQKGGFAKLEFPNKDGLRNSRGPVRNRTSGDQYDSWDVRYYTIAEYREMFLKHFNNFKYSVHSFLGIGVLKEDLRYVSFKNKVLCGVSLGLTAVSKLFRPLQKKADSLYIKAMKHAGSDPVAGIDTFLKAHSTHPGNNLNIIHLLRCPESGSSLVLSAEKDFLFNSAGSLKYPVINGIPILIRSQAIVVGYHPEQQFNN